MFLRTPFVAQQHVGWVYFAQAEDVLLVRWIVLTSAAVVNLGIVENETRAQRDFQAAFFYTDPKQGSPGKVTRAGYQGPLLLQGAWTKKYRILLFETARVCVFT